METTLEKSTSRQKNKFARVKRKEANGHTLDTKRIVINLSDRPLSAAETSLLAKGNNFSITPKTVPTEDIIANIEASIQKLPAEVSEVIRSEASRILRKAKPPQSNITKKERMAIKDLNSNKDIIILPADKGNATVLMNTTDYKDKLNSLLDPGTYSTLQHDPTQKVLRKTNDLIKKSSIPQETKQKLRNTEAEAPRLYGLPKIHKDNIPLRPIVSAIGSPTYHLDKYLSGLLQPHIGQTSSFVKDSKHFVDKLKDIVIGPQDILVSFDVVSLFTNVPLQQALSHLQEIFSEDIINLFRHSLTTTYFQWNQTFYEQKDGVAMGSPLSPVIANFYMEKFEEVAIRTAPKQPSCWLRYVDDTFVIWSHGREELNKFLEHLNRVHPKIQFTMETEENGKLPFLDVLVIKRDNRLGHKVYRKKTHTDRYLHSDSNHHPKQKRGVINTLINRALQICEPQFISEELKHLNTVLQANGYSKKDIDRATRSQRKLKTPKDKDIPLGTVYLPYIKGVTERIGKVLRKYKIQTVYRPTRKLQQYLGTPKDRRDPLQAAGVYRIPCSCGKVYIGTTKRSINTRISEHKRNCRLGQTEKSAVAEHALLDGEHKIMFENTDVLSTTSHYSTRIHLEAIEIHKHTNNFNKKEEGINIPAIWHTILENTRKKPMKLGNAQTSSAYQHINTAQRPTQASVQVGTSTRTLRPRNR